MSTGNTKDIFQYLATGHDQMQDNKIQKNNKVQSNETNDIQIYNKEKIKVEDKNLDQLENIINNVKLAY
jgi:hypothetical protein